MRRRIALPRPARASRRPLLEAMEPRILLAQTFTVINTLDDANPGSLRFAIGQVNADAGSTAAAPDTIAFAIGNGPRTIAPVTLLPAITRPVIVDGTTQPGFNPAIPAPIIELSGGSLNPASGSGLVVAGGSSTIQGLVIDRFQGYGIILQGAGGDAIRGDYVGTDATGAAAAVNGGGIDVNTSSGNTIGGTTPGARNVILGGGNNAIVIEAGAGNVIQGNRIGTNAAGSAPLGTTGVDLATANNTIGGTAAGAGNVISRVGSNAITLREAAATGNLIQGNSIGVDAAGTAPLGNNGGIELIRAGGNTIGGTTAAARNLIAGGVRVDGPATGVIIQGNYIGLNAAGTAAVGASFGDGVALEGANGNTVGGTAPGAGNVLSGNNLRGVRIADGSNNVVQGNLIGTDATGRVAIPNVNGGIILVTPSGAGPDTLTSGNTIGGTAAGARNVISGNLSDGIYVAFAQGNLIQGNLIGVAADGATPLGNQSNGVEIGSGSGNTIGGNTPGAGNLIAHNGLRGVVVFSVNGDGLSQSTGDAILGNSIFANTRLGIDLNGDGVTLNAPGLHTGFNTPNNLPNYPVITGVTPTPGGGTTVTGTLNSTPNTTFTVQFFRNDAPDPSSFGEGQTFLGQSTNVRTLADGNATFTVTLPATVSPTQFVTATATDPGGNTSEFSQLVAGLAVAESGPRAASAVGQDLTFVITLTNAGPAPAYLPTITDTLPSGVTFVSATGGVTPQGNTLTLPVATIPVGGTVRATVVVRATATGTYTNPVSVATVVTNPNPAAQNATASALVNMAASADLAVTVTGPAATVTLGGDVTYTLVATNAGPSTVTDATLTDTLPAGVDFVSATGGVTPVNGVLTFPIGPLAPGGPATVKVTVRPRAAGTFTDAARIASATADPNPGNNSNSANAIVNPAVTPTADLSVTITAAALPAATAGQEVTYTVRVANAGPFEATNVVLTDTLPAGSTFVSATRGVRPVNGVLTFPLGTLAASGGADTEAVVVRLSAPGTVTGSVRVRSDVTDPNPANNTASVTTVVGPVVTPTADLSVTGRAPGSAIAGRAITYSLRVANAGPFGATGVVLTDTLPAGVTFVTATGGVRPVNGVLTFPLGTPSSSGGSDAVNITVIPTAAGRLTNTARVASALADPNLANNSAAQFTTVHPAATADLAVSATTPGPVIVGRDAILTFTVANLGAGPADRATLAVTLPAGVQFLSATGNGKPVAGVLTVFLGTLAPGARGTITVVVRPGAAGTFAVRAAATSAEADATPADNTATAIVTASAPTPGDGPRVVGLRLHGFHRRRTYLVLSFDPDLDPARATDPANYLVIDAGRDGRFGTRNDRAVPLVSASYNPATHTVTLVPARHLDVHHRYQLRVIGTGPRGVTDAAGRLLDGTGDGRAGSDFVGTFDRRNLAGPAGALPTGPIPFLLRSAARRQAR